MKAKEFNELLQASDSNSLHQLNGHLGGSASALQAPPRGAGNLGDSLLYHSDSNFNRKGEKKAYKPTSFEAKTLNC